jgi:hypothetical protein
MSNIRFERNFGVRRDGMRRDETDVDGMTGRRNDGMDGNCGSTTKGERLGLNVCVVPSPNGQLCLSIYRGRKDGIRQRRIKTEAMMRMI